MTVDRKKVNNNSNPFFNPIFPVCNKGLDGFDEVVFAAVDGAVDYHLVGVRRVSGSDGPCNVRVKRIPPLMVSRWTRNLPQRQKILPRPPSLSRTVLFTSSASPRLRYCSSANLIESYKCLAILVVFW